MTKKAIIAATTFALGSTLIWNLSLADEKTTINGAVGQVPISPDWMAKRVFPKINFQDATLQEAVQFLVKKSKDFDPDGKGIVVVVKDSEKLASVRITLKLTNVPLTAVLRYVAMLGDCDLRKEESEYVIEWKAPGAAAVLPPAIVAEKRSGAALMKAVEIVIPKLDFEDSTLLMVIEFLHAKSRSLDPKGEGVNLIWKLGPNADKIRVTLRLDNFSLSEALRQVASQTGYEVIDEDLALIIRPKSR